MTEKLYYYDSYITCFDANIISIKKCKDIYEIILDKTYFYPTSGGQQFDKGKINGCEIIDVKEEGDFILHISMKEPEGTKANCLIDWDRRFDFMQQHTGQHILSHSFLDKLGAYTISAHLGEERNTIDLNITNLNWDSVYLVEQYANQVVGEAHSIRYHFFNNIEECTLKLRKRPVIEGKIRIVEIQDIDCTPCGGTHCKSTSEVGLIKVIGFEKYKGGYRIEFLCGKRAFDDYFNRIIMISSLRNELSSKAEDIISSIKRLKDSEGNLKKSLADLKKNYLNIYAELLIERCVNKNKDTNVYILNEFELDELKYIASIITKKLNHIAILLGKQQDYIAIVITKPETLDINLEEKYSQILKKYEWRGRCSSNLLTGVFLSRQINYDMIFKEFSF